MLKQHTLYILYKLQVRSCIDYAIPVYYHSLKVTDNVKLSKIRYTADKIVSGALHFTGKDVIKKEYYGKALKLEQTF